jgi:hypothetical protein
MRLSSANKTEKTWIIYALGGGWGHLTRALSLTRIAVRNRSPDSGTKRVVKILTNSPYLPYFQAQDLPDVKFLGIPPDAGLKITCNRIRETLLNSDCDCLIVDTFPRGLGGELADILPQLSRLPKILIHRDLCLEYVLAKDLRSFVARHFDAAIVPGEGKDVPLADLPIVRHTSPWLIRNAEELDIDRSRQLLEREGDGEMGRWGDGEKGRGDAETRGRGDGERILDLTLNAPRSKKTILVYTSGKPSELRLFGAIAQSLVTAFPECSVRCLAPILPPQCPPAVWVSHLPGIECLPAADIVVGGGGYNTVSECRAVGVPLIAFAFKRLYDRQVQRVSAASYAIEIVDGRNLADYISATIAAVRSLLDRTPKSPIPHYKNGAVEAVQAIEHTILLRSSSTTNRDRG